MSYIREGVDSQAPGKILLGTLQYLVVSGLGVALLRLSALPSSAVGRKFLLILVAGSIGSVFIRLGEPVWFHLPWPHALGNLVFEVGAWVPMGLALGKLVKN